MISRIIAKIVGTNNERQIKKMFPTVEKINALEPLISSLSDEQLAHKTIEFKSQLAAGKTIDDILPEVFAVVRETSYRTLGQRHFDVQLMGGMVLHQGKISEMKTGEGKTLTATLALYLNALTGKGAHLVTVNDYLARRDSEWMGPIYTFLGLEVACLQNSMTDAERQKAYAADILYATNNELGFDYLRDNMKFRKNDLVQRELAFAIVDEVDSILIDEARTPLIISGSSEEVGSLYRDADRVVSFLEKGTDYEIDEKARTVLLTEAGVDKVEAAFNITNLYFIEHMQLLHHINQALRAHALFKRDVDYVVTDNQVLIVDEFTGRILPGRRYSDGLHQALEAKENVEIERESQTLASITLQNFFRLYKKLAGMTGTAATESEEFHNIYKLDVISIPTNRTMIRKDMPDLIFLTKNAKYKAIVEDIKERHKTGQPVLIGTIAIETSELLSAILTANGIQHEVLNAKQHEREAEIIAHAGERGRITIATNMAGRGTDIKLTAESIIAGGLYILGTERHESRRIDNQLRGRSGRQGDPGESRFYISLEDDLVRIFAGDSLKQKMVFFGMEEDEIIESRLVSKTIERAQERVEKHNFDNRKHLLEYDDVLNQQRIVIYNHRLDALEGENRIYELIRDFIVTIVQELIAYNAPTRNINPEQVAKIYEALEYMTGLTAKDFDSSNISTGNVELFATDLINFLLDRYDLYRKNHNENVIKAAEKWLVLETIDKAWRQHMLNLDHLKEGIGLRGWGQKNPLIEYKREAFDMFREMMTHIRFDIVHHIFHLNTAQFNAQQFEERRDQELEQLNFSGNNDPA
ncbi:MAG TPA: preprotein translocase subunit SecA [Candidatus Babeliales bacterium]|nr:preprotein translocase subunit SecA [Candidatus Babeliales bacterium]